LTIPLEQDIAREAGISVGLLYHYYRSKADLFNELVATVVEGANQATNLIFNSDLSPGEKIQTFARDVVEEIARGKWMSQVYLLMLHHTLEFGTGRKRSQLSEKGLAPLQSVERTIREGQALGACQPGDPAEMTVLFFAAIQGLAIYRITMGDRYVSPSPALLSGLLLKAARSQDA
jgi:AcrR family transcriptional regulator